LSHTFAQNMVHVVFSTKERRKMIAGEVQPRLWAYIAGICRKEGIFVQAIGGMEDHIHCLIQLPPPLPLAKAVLLIKANSSRWMSGMEREFEWQKGYGAFSVSASNLSAVAKYIRNQESHHRKMSFDDEFLALLKKHGMKFDPEYVYG
jgi:REP-associated tyrosine transposase